MSCRIKTFLSSCLAGAECAEMLDLHVAPVHCSPSFSATPGGVCTIVGGEFYKSVNEKQM